jgi:hypothetical protein
MQKGALNDVLKGNYQAAIQKLGGTWASLPSSPYAQPRKSWDQIGEMLGGGISAPQPQRPQTVSWKEISGRSAKPSRPELVRFDSLQSQTQERPKAVKFSEISGEQQDSRPALVAWQDVAGG